MGADEAGAAGDECPHAAHFPSGEVLCPAAVAARPKASHVAASSGIPATSPWPTQTPIAARTAKVATAHGGAFARSASTSASRNGSSQRTKPIVPRAAAAWAYAFCTPPSCLGGGEGGGEAAGNFPC